MEARGEAPGEGGLPVATQAGPGSPGPHGSSLWTSDPELFGLISTNIFNSTRFPGRPRGPTLCDVTLGTCESAGLNTGTVSGVGGWGGHLPSHVDFTCRGFSVAGGKEGSGAGSRSPDITATQGGQDHRTSDLCLLSTPPCLWPVQEQGLLRPRPPGTEFCPDQKKGSGWEPSGGFQMRSQPSLSTEPGQAETKVLAGLSSFQSLLPLSRGLLWV